MSSNGTKSLQENSLPVTDPRGCGLTSVCPHRSEAQTVSFQARNPQAQSIPTLAIGLSHARGSQGLPAQAKVYLDESAVQKDKVWACLQHWFQV